MLSDKNAFCEAAGKTLGRVLLSSWEAQLKTPESILQKSGLLCAAEGGLVFVEDRFGKPGEAYDFPKASIRGLGLEEAFLRVVLKIETEAGAVTVSGRERTDLDRVLADAGLEGALKPTGSDKPRPKIRLKPRSEPESKPETVPETPAEKPRPKIRIKPKPEEARPADAPQDVESLRRARKLKEALFEAIDDGDASQVARLLDQGAPLEARDDEKRTPLIRACEAREHEVVGLLLEGGADVHARDEDGQTPLWHCAYWDDIECARLVLDGGADVDAREDENEETPLHRAEEPEFVELLLDHGADMEARNDLGRTPLAEAADMGHDAKVELLLARGADALARDDDDRTPQEIAEEAGEEIVAALLKERIPAADIEALREKRRLTRAIFDAVDDGDADEVARLIDRGAELDARNEEKATPLMEACSGGEIEIARLLVSRRADLDARDEDGRTPLMHAAWGEEVECIRLLLEAGADPNAVDGSGQTALFLTGEADIAKAILDGGAAVDVRDEEGLTVLAHAAEDGEDEMAELFLKHGADPEARDDEGRTPLDIAREEDEEVMVALLEKWRRKR